jgi:hypothetical protein
MRSFASALIATILLSTTLSACAPAYAPTQAAAPPPATTQDQRFVMQQATTADSLLALPPDSLSEADLRWLELYEQRRARVAVTEQQVRTDKAVENANSAMTVYWVLAGVSLAASLFYLFTLDTDID